MMLQHLPPPAGKVGRRLRLAPGMMGLLAGSINQRPVVPPLHIHAVQELTPIRAGHAGWPTTAAALRASVAAAACGSTVTRGCCQ
jgi:hypothetical protein